MYDWQCKGLTFMSASPSMAQNTSVTSGSTAVADRLGGQVRAPGASKKPAAQHLSGLDGQARPGHEAHHASIAVRAHKKGPRGTRLPMHSHQPLQHTKITYLRRQSAGVIVVPHVLYETAVEIALRA